MGNRLAPFFVHRSYLIIKLIINHKSKYKKYVWNRFYFQHSGADL